MKTNTKKKSIFLLVGLFVACVVLSIVCADVFKVNAISTNRFYEKVEISKVECEFGSWDPEFPYTNLIDGDKTHFGRATMGSWGQSSTLQAYVPVTLVFDSSKLINRLELTYLDNETMHHTGAFKVEVTTDGTTYKEVEYIENETTVIENDVVFNSGYSREVLNIDFEAVRAKEIRLIWVVKECWGENTVCVLNEVEAQCSTDAKEPEINNFEKKYSYTASIDANYLYALGDKTVDAEYIEEKISALSDGVMFFENDEIDTAYVKEGVEITFDFEEKFKPTTFRYHSSGYEVVDLIAVKNGVLSSNSDLRLNYATSVTIQGSLDGAAWFNLGVYNNISNCIYAYDFVLENNRYVNKIKVTLSNMKTHSGAVSGYTDIAEMEFFGIKHDKQHTSIEKKYDVLSATGRYADKNYSVLHDGNYTSASGMMLQYNWGETSFYQLYEPVTFKISDNEAYLVDCVKIVSDPAYINTSRFIIETSMDNLRWAVVEYDLENPYTDVIDQHIGNTDIYDNVILAKFKGVLAKYVKVTMVSKNVEANNKLALSQICEVEIIRTGYATENIQIYSEELAYSVSGTAAVGNIAGINDNKNFYLGDVLNPSGNVDNSNPAFFANDAQGAGTNALIFTLDESIYSGKLRLFPNGWNVKDKDNLLTSGNVNVDALTLEATAKINTIVIEGSANGSSYSVLAQYEEDQTYVFVKDYAISSNTAFKYLKVTFWGGSIVSFGEIEIYKDVHCINYVTDGASNPTSNVTVLNVGSRLTLADASKAGNIPFIGWACNGVLYRPGTLTINESAQVYARFADLNTYDISVRIGYDETEKKHFVYGFRFQSKISMEELDNISKEAQSFVIGTVSIPTKAINDGGYSLTIGGEYVTNLEHDDVFYNEFIKEDATTWTYLFNTVMTQIDSNEGDEKFAKRCVQDISHKAYATITYADGKKVTYYGNVYEGNVYDGLLKSKQNKWVPTWAHGIIDECINRIDSILNKA